MHKAGGLSGFHYVEFDVHETADGQLVCIHDDTLSRPFFSETFAVEDSNMNKQCDSYSSRKIYCDSECTPVCDGMCNRAVLRSIHKGPDTAITAVTLVSTNLLLIQYFASHRAVVAAKVYSVA
jgi:glycerophosphoryl diester phosphodiesterase